jgi:hypothetical protein
MGISILDLLIHKLANLGLDLKICLENTSTRVHLGTIKKKGREQ